MEGEEPSTRLVDAFSDEVGGIDDALVEGFTILKRIVNLSVWHGTAVEPDVDEVEFTMQRLSALAHEDDVVDIRTVQINAVVVLLTHIAGHEALGLKGILLHETSSNSFLNLVVEFFDRAYADFLAGVAIAPDGQRCAPVAAAAEVPVVEVLEPLAEAACTR